MEVDEILVLVSQLQPLSLKLMGKLKSLVGRLEPEKYSCQTLLVLLFGKHLQAERLFHGL
jgi:hypothetical protein